MKWISTHIEVPSPKRPKKITATRLGTILGLNPWSTPFEAWCEITRTYQKPFEETRYTAAGKKIEPLQIDYMRNAYAIDNLKTPTDIYGRDYFKKTWGDFFHDDPIFGGMWDSILCDTNNLPETVLEFKTTKRSEDWKFDIPEYYALQAALYAYLLGVDNVIMVASFLSDPDYDEPEKYIPSSKNTITVEFKVSERYPDFADKIKQATNWWNTHVITGISPDYDEKKDAEILKVLRTNHLAPNTDISALTKEAEQLKSDVQKILTPLEEKMKRIKELDEMIKEYATNQFREGDKKVEISGSRLTWHLSKTEGTTIDKGKLIADGLLEKYSKPTVTYRMTIK